MVAEAKGLRLFIASAGQERWHEISDSPCSFAAVMEVSWDSFDQSLLKYPGELCSYSSCWQHAGPLLDEMTAGGDEALFIRGRTEIAETRLLILSRDKAPISAAGESWPERIALAYRLWKEGQR